MAVNFKDLLSKPVESAERPKPRPAGQYMGTVESFKFDESPQQKTPYVRYTVTGIQPGSGITADPSLMQRLADAGGCEKMKVTKDYYLTDDALYRLREFIESCRIPVAGRSFLEAVPEVVRQPVMFDLVEESYERKDGETGISNKVMDMRGA